MKLRHLKPKLYILQLAFTATAACFYLVPLGHHIGIYNNFTIPKRKNRKSDEISIRVNVCLRCTGNFLLKLVKLVISRAKFSFFPFPPQTHECNLVQVRTKNFLNNACSCPEVFSINLSTRAKTHDFIFL